MSYENLQVNLKTRAGTLINITGADNDELAAALDGFTAQNIERVLAAEQLLTAVENARPLTQPQGSVAQSPQQAAQPPFGGAPQHPAGKSCGHGVLVYKEWTAKSGKFFKAWKCPADDRDCKVIEWL